MLLLSVVALFVVVSLGVGERVVVVGIGVIGGPSVCTIVHWAGGGEVVCGDTGGQTVVVACIELRDELLSLPCSSGVRWSSVKGLFKAEETRQHRMIFARIDSLVIVQTVIVRRKVDRLHLLIKSATGS